ncbi:MAG: outer membrane beta-barrel protein [Campylobacterota bacterium]|nr:outer membrane beta-barrel protein [Campylobacterota bacterium]
MKSLITILCLFYTYLNSYEISSKNININKKGVVLATFKNLGNAKEVSDKFYKYDTFIKETTTTKVPYYVVFAVNIDKKNLKTTLKKIKKRSKSAYITSDSRINQLSKTPIKLSNKQDITNTTKLKIKNEDNIDPTKKSLTIAFAKTKSEALSISDSLKNYDIYIRKSTSKVSDEYIVYIVNIKNSKFKNLSTKIKSKYPNLDETSKFRVNYFKKNHTKNSIFLPKTTISQNINNNKKVLVVNEIKKVKKNTITDTRYQDAKKLFNNKEYQKAIKILLELLNETPSNTAVNFYLGRSYYMIHDYEKASASYERITIADESHLRGRLELAQTYLMLGLKDDAIDSFNLVLKNDIPETVRKNINNKIKNINSQKQKYSFNGFVNLGITYDNNVNNTTMTKNYTVNNYEVTSKDIYSDTILNTLVNANYYYKLNDSFIFENKFTFINQLFIKDSKRLNTSDSSINVEQINQEDKKEMSYINNNLSFSNIKKSDLLTYGIDFSTIELAKKPYLDIYGLFVNHQKRYFSKITFYTSLKYFRKKYDTEYENLNSNNINITIGQSYPSDYYGNFNLVYLYTKEKRLVFDIDAPDKSSNSFMFGHNYNITDKLSLNESFYYSKIDEKSFNPSFYETIREDNLYNISLGLSYKVTKTTSLSSNYKYTKNDSNIIPFNYQKQTFGINIKKSF